MSEYNFSDDVQAAMAAARMTAFRLGQQFVDTEHLLLGVLETAPHAVGSILAGSDHRALVNELEQEAGMLGVGAERWDIPLTPASQRVLSYTMAECRDMRHESVEAGHLLLGLLREEQGIAAQVLRGAGIDFEEAREEVTRKPKGGAVQE